MRIYGLDFTSAPSPAGSRARRQKHLMLAGARLDAGSLVVDEFRPLNGPSAGDFAGFERWLRSPGPWIAGLDFPFAQPAVLVRALGWPSGSWSECVAHARRLGLPAFEAAIGGYCAAQPAGSKHLLRPVDAWARSISPMMLRGVPVGKMFWRGAPRLLDAPASIPILRPVAGESRTVVEAYPALVARRWLGRRSYKNDDPARDDEPRRAARRDLVRAIRGDAAGGPRVADVYGLVVAMADDDADECVADATGDRLDSVLCAVQAAWAFWRRDAHFGMPGDAGPLEGWIADPGPSSGSASDMDAGAISPEPADDAGEILTPSKG